MMSLSRLTVIGIFIFMPLAAHAVTGREFLEDPHSDANSNYVAGAFNMLSQVLTAEDQDDKAACVKAWYHDNRDNSGPMFWTFESYPDMAIEVTLYQLLRQECGFETLKIEEKTAN